MRRLMVTEVPEDEESWWARNKVLVGAIGGLAAGIWLMGGCQSNAPAPAAPSHSSSPAPAPTTGE